MRAVREVVDVPLLRKDFVLDPAQIWEAREAGADAVLLIVAALDDAALSSLIAEASMARLDALVEVHDQPELERARAAGATLIGVNNRDLTTFDTNLAIAERLAPRLGGGIVSIAESGVSDPAGARRMAAAGYDAILVGQALVTKRRPGSTPGRTERRRDLTWVKVCGLSRPEEVAAALDAGADAIGFGRLPRLPSVHHAGDGSRAWRWSRRREGAGERRADAARAACRGGNSSGEWRPTKR